MKYDDQLQTIDSLQKVMEVLKTYVSGETIERQIKVQDQLCRGISEAVHEINKSLFIVDRLNINNLEKLLSDDNMNPDLNELEEAFAGWTSFCKDIIAKREKNRNYVDESFYRIIDMAFYADYDVIVEHVIGQLKEKPDKLKEKLNDYYQTYYYFWGSLDIDNDNFETVHLRIRELIEHKDDFLWLYENLGDYRSKCVLTGFLEYWVSYDPYTTITRMKETTFRDYYDLDLYDVSDDEVVVDLGAYIGDSALDFIRTYHSYKDIYCFEVSPRNVEKMRETLSGYENIHFITKAAGAKKGTMMMNIEDVVASDNTQTSAHKGVETQVEVTTVDDEISEPVTMIKMDIEGAEQDAVKGCERHIRNEHPKLLICVYHNNTDIWKIPRMVTEIYPGYKLYLRANGLQWGPSEIVLFALP